MRSFLTGDNTQRASDFREVLKPLNLDGNAFAFGVSSPNRNPSSSLVAGQVAREGNSHFLRRLFRRRPRRPAFRWTHPPILVVVMRAGGRSGVPRSTALRRLI